MFTEARAAWQRTANRCLVQEDAKIGPKLSCCSSGQPPVKQPDRGITDNGGVNEISNTRPMHLSQNPSYSSLSPGSRWWLQPQPSCGFERLLTDDNFNYLQPDKEVCHDCNSFSILTWKEDDFDMVDQNKSFSKSFVDQCRTPSTCQSNDFTFEDHEWTSVHTKKCPNYHTLEGKEAVEKQCCECLNNSEVFKSPSEHCLLSDTSWITREKNAPWWRNSDTEELAILLAQSPHIVQNCDLPTPQNKYVEKARCPTVKSPRQKLCISSEGETVSDVDKLSSPIQVFGDGSRHAQLLKALHHSQTRAREAEKAAKQATAEKEHILKLILRQASQIFAYRQWLQLVQLENIYLRFKSNKIPPQTTFPGMIPPRTVETNKGKRNPFCKKRSERSLPRCDPWNYAVIIALGLSFVGAGLLLGWTFGWLLLD